MNDNNSQQSPMNSHSAANKMSSHHSQETHGFYNQGMNYGHQYGSNGAGSSSGMSNNFYMPHYSVSGCDSRLSAIELISVSYQQQAPQQQQPQPSWNQQQQYFR